MGARDGELPVAVPRFGGGADRAAEGLALEGHQHRLLALRRRRQRLRTGKGTDSLTRGEPRAQEYVAFSKVQSCSKSDFR